MANIIKVTGSNTISEVVKAFFPEGGTDIALSITCDASPVAATQKRATNKLLSLESLCFALLKSGVVAKPNLAHILSLAANMHNMDEETAKEVESTIEAVKSAIASKLPMVPVAATVRIQNGQASASVKVEAKN